jgi:membrane protein DedA with SNARE-associated domain
MTSYFQGLVDFVGAHPQLSFFAVFLLALSEAIPVVGTVVPGSTLILAVSALATTAGMTPWALVIAAVAGAIVGDGFSFWLGHNYRQQILRGWPLNRFPWVVDRSAQLIRKYGIASVFLARFTAVVRAFVPLLAGVLKMSTGLGVLEISEAGSAWPSTAAPDRGLGRPVAGRGRARIRGLQDSTVVNLDQGSRH